jgi:DNA-binding CsgD family transcriptional regulator
MLSISTHILYRFIFTRLIGTDNKTNNVINEPEKPANYSLLIQRLSRREREVIEAIIAGNKRYKELAVKLNVSVSTVKFHLKNIYQDAGIPNLTALSNFLREFVSNGA